MRGIREMVRDSDAVDLIRHELSTPVATALLYIGIAENYAVRTPGEPISSGLRIFKRYEHAPADQGGGMGLGLWLVRELVMAHGGRITVQSRKGRGTTFTVLLRAQAPLLGGERSGSIRRLPPQRSLVRPVASKPTARPTFPPYWQDRLARSQVKAPSLPRPAIDVAPTSTMTSPSLTAYLKTSWPSRT